MNFTVEKAIKHRVVMLSGHEETLRRRALADLLAVAAPEGDDFDLQTFDASNSGANDWIGSASTAPFLSERRVVVVRHVLRMEEPPTAADGMTLSSLPEYALLILVADEELGDEGRQRKFGTIRKAWEKDVNDVGGFVAPFAVDQKVLPGTIRGDAASLGIGITPGAAQVLAEMTGGSLSRALDELEKLALYVGPEGQIRENDVRSVAIPSREWNVFAMVEAVAAGQAAAALTQLRILIGSANKAEDAAFGRILPMMGRQLRLLWQARLCIEAKVAPSSAPEHIRAMFPEKASIAAEPSYRQQKLMQAAKGIDLVRIQACFQALGDADARLKGMLPGFNSMETLEMMLLTMIESVRGGPAPQLVRSYNLRPVHLSVCDLWRFVMAQTVYLARSPRGYPGRHGNCYRTACGSPL